MVNLLTSLVPKHQSQLAFKFFNFFLTHIKHSNAGHILKIHNTFTDQKKKQTGSSTML